MQGSALPDVVNDLAVFAGHMHQLREIADELRERFDPGDAWATLDIAAARLDVIAAMLDAALHRVTRRPARTVETGHPYRDSMQTTGGKP